MFPSTASALQADAKEIGRTINLARQIFALQSAAPLCLLPPGQCLQCQAYQAAVDDAYRSVLVVEFGSWQQ